MKNETATPINAVGLRSIRRRILGMSNTAKSAHVGSALSCVEILAALFWKTSQNPSNGDKLIFSKGHAASALYATAEHFGQLDSKHLDQYLQNGTSLWGHPSGIEKHSFIGWSTGSLGHGLSVGTGFAYTRKNLNTNPEASVYVVLSDGECDEGSTWEAALFAGHHKLSNLTAVIDYNKIQSFGRVSEVIGLEPLRLKWESFGWDAEEIDGHDVHRLVARLSQKKQDRPTCLIAHTVKGKGVPAIEDTIESHYRSITDEQLKEFDNEK